jgi:hypothetical protein
VFSTWDRLARTFRSSDVERRVATGLPDRVGRKAPALAESLLLPFAQRRKHER